MIIERLILRNFGVYRGANVIDLAPETEERPVILFGGLNGCGKTTLLDAIQLTLYGRLARCSNRGRLGYNEYLRRACSRGVGPDEKCGVEMQLRASDESGESSYRIERSWNATENPTETLNVWRNGHPDPVLATRWAEHVEDLLPIGLSSLFFFDGEKIEKLADLDKSKAIVADALHALLGLDTVDQLRNDLRVLERTKRKEDQSDETRAQIDQLEGPLKANEHQLRELATSRAARQNDLDRAEKALREVEHRFRAQGGDQLENQKQLESDRDVAQDLVAECKTNLIEVAAGVAPLLLVAQELEELQAVADLERDCEITANVDSLLRSRDQWLMKELFQLGAPPEMREKLKTSLSSERKQRRKESKRPNVADLTRADHAALDHLLKAELPDTTQALSSALERGGEAEERLARAEALLASVPEEERVADVLEERRRAREEVERALVSMSALDAEKARLTNEGDELIRRREKLLETNLEYETAQADNVRILDHSERARATLELFRKALVRRHTNRIETLAHDSFAQLMRKAALVKRIEIDPESYEVRLAGGDGEALPADRLSAGERQLLAVALLWGLARASGRPTPVAIDTPLGRLDSHHRINLVERYFPNASHQVLLFSTDEEIDDEHLRRLKPHLGRTYLLRHDDAEGRTRVEPGYFG